MKFLLTVIETTSCTYEVEANSEDEAIDNFWERQFAYNPVSFESTSYETTVRRKEG